MGFFLFSLGARSIAGIAYASEATSAPASPTAQMSPTLHLLASLPNTATLIITAPARSGIKLSRRSVACRAFSFSGFDGLGFAMSTLYHIVCALVIGFLDLLALLLS